jgi:hypothetical protein
MTNADWRIPTAAIVSFVKRQSSNAISAYQLDLVTPGISPASARFRKQRRHSWNFLKYPRERPQRRHRLCARTLNFGVRLALAFMHVLATVTPVTFNIPDFRFQIPDQD